MHNSEVLHNIVILLSTAIFVVFIFKNLKLSPVLGYFVAGALIGDYGAKVVLYEHVESIAEYGVVFLLYIIGLELSFERLKAIRKYVFGLGTLQVILTILVIASCVLFFNGSIESAIIIGGAFALSSTAVVMQVVEETGQQSSQLGRIALAILLLQDLVVVPLLIITPMLGKGDLSSLPYQLGISFLKAIFALILIFLCGRLFLRPFLKAVTMHSDSDEIFIATALLVALASAFGTEYMGLSQALGAFVAGVLVAETEYQHKAEESIKPFKNLLLGLFFMSVGMKIDVMQIYTHLQKIILLSFSLIFLKASIIALLCILFGFKRGVAIHAGLLLGQVGEFSIVLFKVAQGHNIIQQEIKGILLPVITISMALTPLLSIIGKKISDKLDHSDQYENPSNKIELGSYDLTNHVIIAGFGRVGKMVARMLEMQSINYIAIDIDSVKASQGEQDGFPVFSGDASKLENLVAAGAERALSVVIAINNQVTIRKTLKSISPNFPDIPIIVKDKDLRYASELYSLGATAIIPSAYEVGLQLGSEVLKFIGIGESEIFRIKSQFRSANYVLSKQDEDFPDEHES